MPKAVFLDRDGVINAANVVDGKPFPPSNLSELRLLKGVEGALKLLDDAGWLLIVVTNQPDVARGTKSKSDIENIHSHLSAILPIKEFKVCYHDDLDKCSCRKPLPGMILEAAKVHNISLSNSYMIGDRWRDVEAGFNAGCKTIFIDYNYDERQPENFDYSVKSLIEATDIILGESNE